MMNITWTTLNHLQIGRFGEYYAKMLFTAYGFDVYSLEVDDHGVDFVVKSEAGEFFEVQVKSICKTNYMYIKKDKIITDEKHLVALIRLKDGEEPEMYVFPASVWNNPTIHDRRRK